MAFAPLTSSLCGPDDVLAGLTGGESRSATAETG
jgi:hypothetical protein